VEDAATVAAGSSFSIISSPFGGPFGLSPLNIVRPWQSMVNEMRKYFWRRTGRPRGAGSRMAAANDKARELGWIV
jgi:hypothetical protein